MSDFPRQQVEVSRRDLVQGIKDEHLPYPHFIELGRFHGRVVTDQVAGLADLEVSDIVDRFVELDFHHAGEMAIPHGESSEQKVAARAEGIVFILRAVDDPDCIAHITDLLIDKERLAEPRWQLEWHGQIGRRPQRAR